MKQSASSNAARGPAGRRSPSSRAPQRPAAHPPLPRPRVPAPEEAPYESPYGLPYEPVRETPESRPAGRGPGGRPPQNRPRTGRPPSGRPSGRMPSDGRPPGRGKRPAPQDGQRPGAGRLLLRVLTHNVTIISVVLGVIVMVALNFHTKGKAPRGAGDMSANDAAAALDPRGDAPTDMDPIAAAVVAHAKERAHIEQVKAEREARRLETKRQRERAIAAAKEKARRALEAMKHDPSVAQNKAYAKQLSAAKGWGRCWGSLDLIWTHESHWNERADNPSSDAYGIPQALPGSKMATFGADWQTNAATQIKWGLSYIGGRYGDPCKAWNWWAAHRWY